MKERIYLFGAYIGSQPNGKYGYGNFLLEFPSMPSFEDLKEAIKKRQEKTISDLVVLNMQFLTKEQFYALKGEEGKQESSQSESLDKKIDDSSLSIRTKNICKANGLNTVRDICRLAKTDWLKFRNGGMKSLNEIDDFLKDNGLDWGMNV